MRIAVLGTGMVGQALAGKLAELGHEVVAGTRDPGATMSRTEPDYLGNPPFKVWREAHPEVARQGLPDQHIAGGPSVAAGRELCEAPGLSVLSDHPRCGRDW